MVVWLLFVLNFMLLVSRFLKVLLCMVVFICLWVGILLLLVLVVFRMLVSSILVEL